jgi:hypothetical protein
MEAKLLNGTAEPYHALDEAIRTAECPSVWTGWGRAGMETIPLTHLT